MVVVANFDYLFLQSIVPEAEAARYNLENLYLPAYLIGFALTQVTVPLAMVLFPKVVRSAATGVKSDAFMLAMVGTALVGGLAALGVMVVPALPLQILYHSNPLRWAAAPLVPWLVWAMLAYALANVLVSTLLARAQFLIVPIVALIAAGYVAALRLQTATLLAMEPADAYKRVAATLAAANLVLLIAAVAVLLRSAPKAGPGPGATGSAQPT
jgi:hypothetical protein